MPEPDHSASTSSPVGAATEAAPGSLVVHIGDGTIEVAMVGGGNWTLPIGVCTVVDGPLEGAARLRPEHLTNALGAVTDHLDDVLIDSPIVGAASEIMFAGPHALMVARVELGADDVPDGYVLERVDADEVFRTLVAEPRDERVHNPGLSPDHVDTVVAACCVILAVLRRLDLQRAEVRA